MGLVRLPHQSHREGDVWQDVLDERAPRTIPAVQVSWTGQCIVRVRMSASSSDDEPRSW